MLASGYCGIWAKSIVYHPTMSLSHHINLLALMMLSPYGKVSLHCSLVIWLNYERHVCQYVLPPLPTLLNKYNSVNLYGDPIQDCLNHLYSLIWQLSLSLQSSVLQRESVRMFLVRVVGVTERIVFPHSCVLVVRGGVTITWKLHGPFSFQSKKGRRWGCYSSPSPSPYSWARHMSYYQHTPAAALYK